MKSIKSFFVVALFLSFSCFSFGQKGFNLEKFSSQLPSSPISAVSEQTGSIDETKMVNIIVAAGEEQSEQTMKVITNYKTAVISLSDFSNLVLEKKKEGKKTKKIEKKLVEKVSSLRERLLDKEVTLEELVEISNEVNSFVKRQKGKLLKI